MNSLTSDTDLKLLQFVTLKRIHCHVSHKLFEELYCGSEVIDKYRTTLPREISLNIVKRLADPLLNLNCMNVEIVKSSCLKKTPFSLNLPVEVIYCILVAGTVLGISFVTVVTSPGSSLLG